jgi:hypothetical protein
MADLNFRRAMEIFSGQPVSAILSRPVGDALIVLLLYTYYIGIFPRRNKGASLWKRMRQRFSST